MASSRGKRPSADLQTAIERMAGAVLREHQPGDDLEGEWVEGLAARMERIYADAFPKACRCCGRVYRTPEEYQRETLKIGGPGSAYFDPEDETVQEFRDCPCGSTLLLLTGDRRDTSPAGEARRELFDECVGRLRRLTGRPAAQLRPMVRHAFRAAMGRLSVSEDRVEELAQAGRGPASNGGAQALEREP